MPNLEGVNRAISRIVHSEGFQNRPILLPTTSLTRRGLARHILHEIDGSREEKPEVLFVENMEKLASVFEGKGEISSEELLRIFEVNPLSRLAHRRGAFWTGSLFMSDESGDVHTTIQRKDERWDAALNPLVTVTTSSEQLGKIQHFRFEKGSHYVELTIGDNTQMGESVTYLLGLKNGQPDSLSTYPTSAKGARVERMEQGRHVWGRMRGGKMMFGTIQSAAEAPQSK